MSTLERPYVLPGEPLPVRLLNTLWAERGDLRDDLTTPTDALTWLRTNGFPTKSVAPSELDAVVELRAALRTVAGHLTGDDRVSALRVGGDDPSVVTAADDVAAALVVIDEHSALAPTGHLALVDGQVQWSTPPPGSTIEDALAVIAAAAAVLFTGPDASRLRACHGPRCVLYFVQDHSRRQWCSLACGNRARAARHYRRHQDETAPRSRGKRTSEQPSTAPHPLR
ncbi:CGNR zinc finger domain-containing protein [Paenibacillus sp. TRM 82003]|uniref:CGNR zinc finger domain-containing protein n=1 Tax=Kineococcus sp. TRM81007 TaxID=2925831 RepID=UPI001F565B5F|nr:CGNR zinc finger domain-containing protein [Kineococcus sp. TRM81007]MCI2240456.1 CGNR zinc finger domain-containing protein [Kineococcus sp. TRM81007]MCI3927366.1 CGNR zinc finger domain-containing protein [Paenibacillus sp. TRM 82003]